MDEIERLKIMLWFGLAFLGFMAVELYYRSIWQTQEIELLRSATYTMHGEIRDEIERSKVSGDSVVYPREIEGAV